MSDLDLRALSAKATEGPWFVRKRPTDDGLAVIEDGRSDGLFPITGEWHDIEFIVEVANAYRDGRLTESPASSSGPDYTREDYGRLHAQLVEVTAEQDSLRKKLDVAMRIINKARSEREQLEATNADLRRQLSAADEKVATTIDQLMAANRRAAEDIESFIQASIDSAPEPLRRLGEWLSHKLDDDDWKTAERLLTGAAVALRATHPAATAAVPDEAVQVAARAIAVSIVDAPAKTMQSMRKHARAALEAARPLLAPAVPSMPKAAADVLAERQRQVEVEGRTPERLSVFAGGDIARVSACYILSSTDYPKMRGHLPPSPWPWDRSLWRPQGRRSDLVHGVVLGLLEIERLDRAATPPAPTEGNA